MIKLSESPRILIVESRYYDDIADNLLAGTRTVLDEHQCHYDVAEAPGALEIPAVIKYAIRSLAFNINMERYDGFIALGCVIRGETGHYDIVAEQSASGLMQLSLQYSLAVGNGILTVDTKQQAEVRADPSQKNKGGEAATAVLKMLVNKEKFSLYPRLRK